MWQLGVLFGVIPTFFWKLALVIGIGCLIFSYFTTLYKIPLKIGGIVSIIVSSWFLGIAANEEKWQKRVKDLEEKLSIAQKESDTENVRVEEKIIYKDRIIKQQGDTRVEYIDRVIKEKEEIIKYIENCPVPVTIIEEHNKAIINQINEAAKKPKGELK